LDYSGAILSVLYGGTAGTQFSLNGAADRAIAAATTSPFPVAGTGSDLGNASSTLYNPSRFTEALFLPVLRRRTPQLLQNKDLTPTPADLLLLPPSSTSPASDGGESEGALKEALTQEQSASFNRQPQTVDVGQLVANDKDRDESFRGHSLPNSTYPSAILDREEDFAVRTSAALLTDAAFQSTEWVTTPDQGAAFDGVVAVVPPSESSDQLTDDGDTTI
jgi:hypothetical protein